MFKGFFTVNHLPRTNQSVLVYNSTIFKPTELSICRLRSRKEKRDKNMVNRSNCDRLIGQIVIVY